MLLMERTSHKIQGVSVLCLFQNEVSPTIPEIISLDDYMFFAAYHKGYRGNYWDFGNERCNGVVSVWTETNDLCILFFSFLI